MLPVAPLFDIDETCVALDLETTGLDPNRDRIIQVGAVKFRGRKVLDNLVTFVNPGRAVPEEITRLTGIASRDVAGAPPFAEVAPDLVSFLGDLPVVGQNIGFDLAFLANERIHPSGPSYDTQDLAFFLLPEALDRSLEGFARTLGVAHPRPHRADADAETARLVFLALVERFTKLDPGTRRAIAAIIARSKWGLSRLLTPLAGAHAVSIPSGVGLLGLDEDGLKTRMTGSRAARGSKSPATFPPLDPDALSQSLAPDGALAKAFPGYERRPQQEAMLRAVTEALRDGEHLIVEGGTGVGKTVAYLIPAMVMAATQGKRVVVSTNTINLQEQLVHRDIPWLNTALEAGGLLPKGGVRVAVLKGRANYLCYRRWSLLARSESLDPGEAKLLARTLLWLRETATGDRGELNLPGRDAPLWSRVSSGEEGKCPGNQSGVCFVRASRERAEAAQIVVVNHALLMTDLANGGGVIPDHDYLIVDEAHHLEQAATDQFSFSVPEGELSAVVDDLGRIQDTSMVLFRASLIKPERRAAGMVALEGLRARIAPARDRWGRLFGRLGAFAAEQEKENGRDAPLRITPSKRTLPGWSEVEATWENLGLALKEIETAGEALARALDGLTQDGLEDAEVAAGALGEWLDRVETLRAQLHELIAEPSDAMVYWADVAPQDGSLTVSAAPLDVGNELGRRLFDRKQSIVLTSATLAINGSFSHVRERLGLEECRELQVDSPFDYAKSALLLLPDDVPEPEQRGFQEALARSVDMLARAFSGHTMVLFTSHSSLRQAARLLARALDGSGVRVIAQGPDGPPRRVVERFQQDPRAVLLGTASLWEGVDLPAGVLRVLVVARLPFNVPSDPIFAARSEQYDSPFAEYAVPQAVLRFRQGFGRLIRRKADRGLVLVLDRRVQTRGYGRTFVQSLPPVTVRQGPLQSLLSQATTWLGSKG